MYDCGFLDGGYCGGNQYLLTSYYASAFPVIALFALGCRRFPLAVFQITYFTLQCSLALPKKPGFARNAINFIVSLTKN